MFCFAFYFCRRFLFPAEGFFSSELADSSLKPEPFLLLALYVVVIVVYFPVLLFLMSLRSAFPMIKLQCVRVFFPPIM